MPTVKYHLQGESKALEASLKKSRREFEKTELVADVYGITLKEAAAALRDVARAEKQAAHATNNTADKLEAAKQAATGFGGTIGGVGGQVEAFTRGILSLNKGMGPLAAGAGVAAVGIVGVGFAASAAVSGVLELIDAAGEARERLDEIAGTEPLPAASIAALDEFGQQALGAEAATARLTVILGGVFADAFVGIVPLVSAAADSLSDFFTVVHEIQDELFAFARTLTAVFSLGASEAIRFGISLNDVGAEAALTAAGLVDLTKSTEELTETVRESVDVSGVFARLHKVQRDQERKAAKQRAQDARDLAQQQKDELANAKKLDEFLTGIRKGRERGELAAEAEAAEAYAQALREVGHEADALARTFDEAIQHQIAVRDGFNQLTDSSINAVGAWGSALQNFVQEGSAAFTAFFAIQQAAAAAGIIVDTGRAVMMTLATVPPPAGPALAIAVAATGAAQLANVVAASIGGGGSISAPGGGSGGAAGAIGQADTLQEQATAGAGSQPSDGTGPVFIQFRHELYDATVPTASRIPGSAMSRVRKNGARVGQRAVAGTPRKLLA